MTREILSVLRRSSLLYEVGEMFDLSVVIVAHNLGPYLEKALYSCLLEYPLTQEFIVVDNGSSDSTPVVAQQFEQATNRCVMVIRNDSNRGPGEARNQGLNSARGKFLVFLDGDDWYQKGGLAKALKTIMSRDSEILMFNHQRVWDTGEIKANVTSNLLYEHDASAPHARSLVIMNFSVVWNKIYRTSFLRALGVKFTTGFYEDVSWTFEVLIKARSVYVIPDIVVNYRQREGSITRSRDERHFDILQQYRLVYANIMASEPVSKIYGVPVYRYARQQILNILNQGLRLPKRSSKTFMAEAFKLLSDWRVALRLSEFDVRYSMLRFANYQIYRLTHLALNLQVKLCSAAALQQLKIQLQRVGRQVKRAVNHFVYRNLFCRMPVQKNKVLFESYWGRKADCNPLSIARRLSKIDGYRAVYSLNNGSPGPDFPIRTTVKNSLEYLYHCATAGTLISNTNFPDVIEKRHGTTHVQTWHGTPVKVMGLDIRQYRPKEMDWERLEARCKRWDFVISPNEHTTRAWRGAFPYDYKVIETGYPRNDIFFSSSAEDIKGIRKAIGVPEGKRIALYAPTVRDNDIGEFIAGGDIVHDPAAILDALGPEWVLLIRSHYFQRGVKSVINGVLDVSEYPRSNEVAIVSDILISDYSSLMFDFACLLRPIVCYAYDYEEYKTSRGVYLDIRDTPPGPVVTSREELVECLRTRAFESAESRRRLESFNRTFCYLDDGHATERVLQEVFGLSID